MLCVTMTIVSSFLQLEDQLLDLGGGDRVEGRARLVHQQHLGLHREGPRDAQPLLLAARRGSTPDLSRSSFTSSHRAAWRSARSTVLVQPARSRTPPSREPGRDVVEDGHGGERVRLLEDHADPPAHLRPDRRPARRCPRRSSSTCPSTRAPGTISCIRLRQRMKRGLAAARRPDDARSPRSARP